MCDEAKEDGYQDVETQEHKGEGDDPGAVGIGCCYQATPGGADTPEPWLLAHLAGIMGASQIVGHAMILVVLGSLIAVGAIVSLEVISAVTHSDVPGDTMLQQAQ
jgi:hypothetical protein